MVTQQDAPARCVIAPDGHTFCRYDYAGISVTYKAFVYRLVQDYKRLHQPVGIIPDWDYDVRYCQPCMEVLMGRKWERTKARRHIMVPGSWFSHCGIHLPSWLMTEGHFFAIGQIQRRREPICPPCFSAVWEKDDNDTLLYPPGSPGHQRRQWLIRYYNKSLFDPTLPERLVATLHNRMVNKDGLENIGEGYSWTPVSKSGVHLAGQTE